MRLVYTFLLLSFLLPALAFAQRNEFDAWQGAASEGADTGKDFAELTQDEKDVIYYLNLARMNGKLFAETYVNKYAKAQNVNKDNPYLKSLLKTLKNQPPLPPLSVKKELIRTAKAHAEAMGKAGKMGHSSVNGTTFDARIYKELKKKPMVAENCSYGIKNPMEIVVDLLIDEGITTLGHRKNMLSDKLTYIGVGIAPHQKYRVNCVMDFAGK